MAAGGSSVSSDKWQLKATTVRERNELMFNNELLSDIRFVVGPNKDRVPAHKYVLAISSPVFLAMFYGRLPETGEEIVITDTDIDSFIELLRFLYTDKVFLTLDNALGVLYLAKKYILPVLAEKCTSFVKKNINSENVLTVLSHSQYLNETALEDQCWDVIDSCTSEVLETDSFKELDQDTLCSLVRRDSLGVKEVSLFRAVKLWCEVECARQNLDSSTANIRTVGSKPLKYIRYPVMAPTEFADEVARTGLLSLEEVTAVFLYFLSSLKTKIPFESLPRQPKAIEVKTYFRCSRFKSCCGNDWFCDTRKNDGIKFMTDKTISMRGIGVYGPSKVEGDYKVHVEVLVHDKILAHNKVSYSSTTCNIIQDILFEESITLLKNVIYTINVQMKGPCSLSGTEGQRSVVTEGVKFSFLEYTSPNGTSLSAGQIPEIIFHL